MSHDPKAIANYFLDRAADAGDAPTPMKVQKLVYYANGFYLAIFGEPLIDEQVEAWAYGPVIPSLHREFLEYGNGPITARATHERYVEDPGSGDDRIESTVPAVDSRDPDFDAVTDLLD